MAEKVLMKGNEALAEAAIMAGCRYYLKFISATDAIIVKLEYVWVQYKHKNHDIDWLTEQQKDICNDYIKAKNGNLVQVTYPLNKRMEKKALEKAEIDMLNQFENDKGE